MTAIHAAVREMARHHTTADERLVSAAETIREIDDPGSVVAIALAQLHEASAAQQRMFTLAMGALESIAPTLDAARAVLHDLDGRINAQINEQLAERERLTILPPNGTTVEDIPLHVARAIEAQVTAQIRAYEARDQQGRIDLAIAISTLRFLIAVDTSANSVDPPPSTAGLVRSVLDVATELTEGITV